MIRKLRKAARSLLSKVSRGVILPAALRRFHRPKPECPGVEVHTLASSKTFDAALLAFASLEFHSRRRWQFVLHDDGSLQESHFAQLHSFFPDARYLRRKEADELADKALAQFPRCRNHRAKFNLALKFFDPPLAANARRWILLDADIVFFRYPEEIVRWAEESQEESLYNQDTREKFCMPRPMIESRFPCQLPPRFNSGLILFPGPALGLARAEAFFEACEEDAHAPQFIEQTLWALAAGEGTGGAQALPRSYNVSWGYWREKGSIARHYVGEFKNDLLYIEGATHMLLSLLTRTRTSTSNLY